MTCESGFSCRMCHETVCAPCDVGQPECEHMGDLCSGCRMACGECRVDRAEDEGSAA